MKYSILLFLIFIFSTMTNAQENDKLPYYEIPEYTGEYTAGSITARMIDGLGFRYRWATENLREEDLNYKSSDEGRSTKETIDHIYGLSRIIANSALKIKTDFTKEEPELTYEQKRKITLENFQQASAVLIKATNLDEFKIQFVFSGGSADYPFWNQINGPIADAIWHSGQIASFRRASGNPISSKVDFLQGKIGE